jgi:hypothetical protein
MDREHVKGAAAPAKAAVKDTAGKDAGEKVPQPLVNFDKPLGSSHNDEADLRDVARKAAKKSQ